jgi:ubiquinone/menaquinone biosynthesis C-methylase UbiE
MVSNGWRELSREAKNLLSKGRSNDALRLYKRIAQLIPLVPEVHNNLAVVLRSEGFSKEAIKSYRKAIKLNPNYTVARKNMARALLELNHLDECLEQFTLILKKTPDDSVTQSELAGVLCDISFSKPSIIARQLFIFLLGLGSIDLQRLSTSIVSLLTCNRRFAILLEAAQEVYGTKNPCRFLVPRELGDKLLTGVLTWTIVPSKQIEIWITVGRQQLLFALDQRKKIDTEHSLLWALALQCQATELVFSITTKEMEIANRLSGDLKNLTLPEIAVVMMFLPAKSLPEPLSFWKQLMLLDDSPLEMKILLQREIFDRVMESEVISKIPKLTNVKDGVSKQVMSQYEKNPYPRWLSVDLEKKPLKLSERLKDQFSRMVDNNLNFDKPEILIAGCGTGRHAISTANRYAGSNVLAIDLSLISLGYAARQAKKLNQKNLQFAQADILNLNTLEKRFDLIESSGVLHHMQDPYAGWESLRRLLKPNGLMRIGLYSSKGRRRWNNLRDIIPLDLSDELVPNFIRARRLEILVDSTENIVTSIADFYSVSGCRDLLYHSNEIQFSIPEITKILEKLNLKFLGFANLSESVLTNFNMKFASNDDYYNLKKWEIFEQGQPDTFLAMYQFWCQAND